MSSQVLKKDDLNDWLSDFGPLEVMMRDPRVTEIMVNGTDKIFVEEKGVIKRYPSRFPNTQALNLLLKKIAAFIGHELNEENPCFDGRLPDGSRVNIVIPPVAVDGPSLTIRKFSPFSLTHTDLIESGMFDERIAYFLSCCVQSKINLVICGGTGSGKTTLLNVLSSFVGQHERIVSIEDTAELKIKNENLVRLEARAANAQKSEVGIRDLVKNALRMRPDRILVGECRGAEALDMLFAMNTGHEGSMTTLHANSCREGLRRLEGMVLMGGVDFPISIVRDNISSAVELMLYVQRMPNGSRKLTEIIEVGRMEGDVILTQEIFKYDFEKGFLGMGFVPRFVHRFKEHGVKFPPDFFTDKYQVKSSTDDKKIKNAESKGLSKLVKKKKFF